MDDDYDEEEKRLYEEFYNLMGAKIRFKCDGYVQEGIIHQIRPGGKRVLLNDVYFICPDERIPSGLLKYRFKDLANYEVVATAKELYPYPRFEYLENLIKNSYNASKQYTLSDMFIDGSSSEESDEDENQEPEFELEVPKHLEKEVPFDSVVIDSIDLEYKQAVEHIRKQKVIGASFQGQKVSRLGKLSWVCISTSWCVFLFDIEKLGVDAFVKGLKSIFEDMMIKKVVHDCRFPSDCLAHQFDTKLVNVFDTLIADFVVSMQYYNDKYKYVYVQCLNSCLRIHLDIQPEFSYARDRCLRENDDDNYLSQRPINNALRYVLIKETIYLMLLHDTLAKKLLGPLHTNVGRYLRAIAGSNKQELDTVGDLLSSPDTIPPSLLMHGIQTVRFRKPVKKDPVSLECKFRDPTSGKLIDVKKYPHQNSNRDNCINKVMSVKKCNKENCSSAVERGRRQELPLPKNKKEHFLTEPSELEKKSVVVDRMVAKCSTRHIDEVYHKLVNNEHFRSQNAHSVINVKPPEKYVSKFTMRMPLNCVAFSDSSSRGFGTHAEKDLPSTSESFPDYSDTWAKLRSDFSEPQISNNKSKNMKFVPAGMSC